MAATKPRAGAAADPRLALPASAVARGRFRRQTPEEMAATFAGLRAMHPDAHCELDHRGPFQLLCATVLSAQTTDVAVNKATPALFARFPDARALANADPAEVERLVGTLGFFRQKTRSLIGLAQALVRDHGGEVPRTLDELVKLPGVGRKTAARLVIELKSRLDLPDLSIEIPGSPGGGATRTSRSEDENPAE